MAKRLIALLLCLVLAAGIFACGSGESSEKDTTPADTSDTNAPVDDGPKSGVPDGTKFEGQTVRIINGQYYDKWFYLMNATETNGDTINDAVYNRNLAVSQKLGVTFEITDKLDFWNDQQAKNVLVKNYEAGDQEYDIYQTCQYTSVSHPINGRTYNLNQSDYFNWEAEWWATDYIEAMNFGLENVHLVGGDISIGYLNQLGCVYYNKSIYEDFYGDGEALLDEVVEGKWTIDRMYTLSSGAWEDLNGNNKIDKDDAAGYMTSDSGETLTHLFFGAGGFTTEFNDAGEMVISQLNEKNVGIVEKLYKLIYENPGFISSNTASVDIELEGPAKFSEGNLLFMSSWLHHADLLRDMADGYGVIPMPKYSEEDDYHALIHNQAATFMIPSVTSTADMSCAVLEEMAFQGWLTMVPAYYETALKVKYVRGDQEAAAQVIDMISAGITTDAGYAFTLGSVGYAAQECLKSGTTNYASQLASVMKKAEEALAKRLEFYQN